MSRLNQLSKYRKHLEERYNKLVERSNDYKYIDEIKSDRAAYKAMKILGKLNKVNYLNKKFSNIT
ncbi:MAG: Lacal_2735 family protein [Flavobacteriaceae bacterium]|nr:Lacal_2735 family protein [Flavobacteriaceae bacterium]